MKKFVNTLSIKKAVGLLVIVLVIGLGSLAIFYPKNTPNQRISDEGDTPRGVTGKPDLMLSPRIMPVKPNVTSEMDVTYSPNLATSYSNVNLIAVSFIISYPKDLIENVTFTPGKALEHIVRNTINTEEGTITFTAVDRDNNYKYINSGIGRITFKTKAQGTAQFSFTTAEMGFNTNIASLYFSTGKENLSTHNGTVYIRNDGAFLETPPLDPIPSEPQSPDGTVVLFRAYKDVNGHATGGRNFSYQEFNDANNNGIYDSGEDYVGKDQGIPYGLKDPLTTGVSFKVTGPFVLLGNRFTTDVSVNQNGYAVIADTGATGTGTQSYTLSDLTIPTGYYVSSIDAPYSSPLTFTATPTNVGIQVTKDNISSVGIGIREFKKITGTVFIDTNGDGIKDEDEVGKSGVTISIQNNGTGGQATVTTGSNGTYSYQIDPANNRFVFRVTATPPSGFTVNGNNPVSVPGDNVSHVVNFALITPGSPTITDAPNATDTPPVESNTPTPNVPTETEAPTASPTPISETSIPEGGALLKISVSLPGIGTRFESDNKSPVDEERAAQVQLIGSENAAPINASGTLAFNGSEYKGYVVVPSITPGNYQIKVRLNTTLYKVIPGIYNINDKKIIDTTPVRLTNGDFNQDQVLDLLDYNIMLACVQGKPACDEATQKLTDLNSDGRVAEADYSIFVRQFDVREGD